MANKQLVGVVFQHSEYEPLPLTFYLTYKLKVVDLITTIELVTTVEYFKQIRNLAWSQIYGYPTELSFSSTNTNLKISANFNNSPKGTRVFKVIATLENNAKYTLKIIAPFEDIYDDSEIAYQYDNEKYVGLDDKFIIYSNLIDEGWRYDDDSFTCLDDDAGIAII